MPLDPRSVTPVAFKRVLSENAQGHIGSSWATQVGRPTTLVPFAQNWSLGYESDLKQGCWIQWPQLYHPQMATVSKIMSPGPQLGSQGYPREGRFAYNGSIYNCEVWKSTKSRWLNPMVMPISLPEQYSVRKKVGRTPARVPRVP